MKTSILLAIIGTLICSAACHGAGDAKSTDRSLKPVSGTNTINIAKRGKKMTVQGESLVLAKTDPGNLCFDKVVKGSAVVRSTYKADKEKSIVYKEGVDYILDYDKGTIARTENSSIPDFSKNILYGQKDFDHNKFPGFTNSTFFVWVDYGTTNGQQWAEPNGQTRFLAKTRAKLEAGGPFTIVSYGDSITSGGEASEPDLQFNMMYGKYLQKKFPKAQITVQDVSIPGYSSTTGIAQWDTYIGTTTPDLVLLGWGMNDHNVPGGGGMEPDDFRKNLVTLVNMVRERKGAEVILYSTFPPNNDWHFGTHRMDEFAKATKQAAAETNSAYVNVYDTWDMVLRRKDQSSLLGNNINHPNDFGHWMYLQAFEAMKF